MLALLLLNMIRNTVENDCAGVVFVCILWFICAMPRLQFNQGLDHKFLFYLSEN